MENLQDRISEALIWARTDAGLTRDQLAEMLGVSAKTVQNWENGIGCPRLDQAIELFQKMKKQPMPYFMRLTREEISSISIKSSDTEVRDALHSVVDELSPEDARKVLYCALYHHGSSPSGIIDEICANLHTPLKDRISIAMVILSNYKLACAIGTDVGKENVQPNVEYLERCILEATEAAANSRSEYNTTGGKHET